LAKGGSQLRTAIVVKPDAIRRRLVCRLRQEVLDRGLKIVDEKEVRLTKELVARFQPFVAVAAGAPAGGLSATVRKRVVEALCAGPVRVWLIEGRDAIIAVRNLKVSFRREHEVHGGIEAQAIYNLLHAPDDEDEAARLVEIFFP